MQSSCIAWPEKEPLLLIRRSQLALCDGNHCAAALLSFFEYGHNNKLHHREQAEHANQIARQHGEEGTQDTSLYQFQTEQQLEERLLHLYGRKTIRLALDKLVEKGFVSLHANPHSRYRFDKTRYFLFHPDKVMAELRAAVDEVKVPHRENSEKRQNTEQFELKNTQESSQVIEILDEVKVPHREGTFTSSSGKNASPIIEITDREEDKDLFSAPVGADSTVTDTMLTGNGRRPPEPYSKGFCAFYGLYPTKREKDNAWKAWKALRLEPYTEVICRSVVEHKQNDSRWREGYIPYPAKFLKNGGWKDQLGETPLPVRKRRVAL